MVEAIAPDPADCEGWSRALTTMLGEPVTVLSIAGEDDSWKAHGMTCTMRMSVRVGGRVRQAYLKTPREQLYAETLATDARREVAWRIEGYPWFAGHVRCAAVGRVTASGLVPMAVEEFTDPAWVLEWAADGIRYADRLARLHLIGPQHAAEEARQLCAAMVAAHRPVDGGDPVAQYRRALRDALIVPIHRLVDSADVFWRNRRELRMAVEHGCARWRLTLADRHDRLRYVHHDFHPWNVFYCPDTGAIRTIGARLPGFGDPYDDVAGFAVNYLWMGHARDGAVEGAYLAGFSAFLQSFLDLGGVDDGPMVMAPFLAKRLLVLLNPVYYPTMPVATAGWLEALLWRCLDDRVDIFRGQVRAGFPPADSRVPA
jgi:hypothetical protein